MNEPIPFYWVWLYGWSITLGLLVVLAGLWCIGKLITGGNNGNK